MAREPLGIGVVGFGWMGKTHTYAHRSLPFYYRELPRPTRMVGVCVRRAETIDDSVALGGFEFGTTDYQQLLDRDDIHAIHVCTPNQLHAEQVIAALNAGKHVYCDKPLAVNGEQARQIATACDAHPGCVTQVALQYRFYPCTMRAKQLIEEGRLGRVWSFRCSYLHASLVDADRPLSWRQRPDAGGGTLNDMGSHLLDMIQFLLGPVAGVMADSQVQIPQRKDPATGELDHVVGDDQTAMLVRMHDGALGTADVSKLASGVHDELRVEIHGQRGALRFNLADPNHVAFYDATEPDEPMGGERGFKKLETIGRYPPPAGAMLPGKLNIGWINAHIASVYHFVVAIAGQAKPHPDFHEAAALQDVLDAAALSSKNGTWTQVAER